MSEHRAYLLELLSRRDYPRRTLERKLKARGVTPAYIIKFIDDLIADGYYNPQAYAQSKTRSLLKKGFGTRVAQAKLKRDGLSLSPEELAEIKDRLEVNDLSLARTAVEKELRRHARAERELDPDTRQKIIQSALRKGHSYSEVKEALAEALLVFQNKTQALLPP